MAGWTRRSTPAFDEAASALGTIRVYLRQGTTELSLGAHYHALPSAITLAALDDAALTALWTQHTGDLRTMRGHQSTSTRNKKYRVRF